MPETALILRVHGRVQGVGYRDWMMDSARKLGIAGWVRNRMDRTVEALVAGEEDSVRELIRQCHKGPWLAKVERIEEMPTQDIAELGNFSRKPTV